MLTLDGRSFDILTLDFETYYDKDYTLKKLSTSEFVRDQRFLALMCGVKLNDGPTEVLSGPDLRRYLKAVNWKRTALLAHNTAFDGFILHEHYGVHAALYLDTLSMARGALGHNVRHDLDTVGTLMGLGKKVEKEALEEAKGRRELPPELHMKMARYCAGDVDLCYDVFHALYEYVPDEELELIDITLRMFCDPVLKLDTALAQEELDEEIASKVRAVMTTGVTKKAFTSNVQFAEELTRLGVVVPMKTSPATGKPTHAFAKTDAGFQALLTHPLEKVRQLAKGRLTVKSSIGESRAQRFLDAGKGGARVPVLLHYYGAHTGRWSGGNKMNMQNLPRQEYLDDGSPDLTTARLRRALLAPKGKVLVVADSGQIEARVNAWIAGQNDVVDIFRKYDRKEGPDAYKVMASKMFGVPIDQVTKAQRQAGKVCVLALGYGMGVNKLIDYARNLDVHFTYEEAADYVDIYRRTNHCIPRFWRHVQGLLPRMTQKTTEIQVGPLVMMYEAIRLPNGMFLRYPQLEVDAQGATFAGRNGMRNKLYGGLLTENIVQALARVIVADQMRVIHKKGYRAVMTTHDEVVALATPKQADKALEFMIKTMSTPPDWAPGLPLAAEGGWAENYSK